MVIATHIHRRPTLVVSSGGAEIPGVQLDASWQYGFDKRIADASFKVNTLPSWLDFWSPITIAVGASDATTHVRFSGYITDFPNYQHAPRGVTVECRGPLIKADTPLVGDESNDVDIPGIDLSNKTAAEQAQYILDASGLQGEYDPGDIQGTGEVLGTQSAKSSGTTAGFWNGEVSVEKKTAVGNKNPNVWKRNESGLSFIKKRDEVELGFWLFETLVPGQGLQIVRHQVSPRPSSATPDVTLTEGTDGRVPDIDRGSSAAHSIDTTVNRVVVIGFDPGKGPHKAIAQGSHPRPIPGVECVTKVLQSPLLEKPSSADAGEGLGCDIVAAWKLDELNHIMLKVEIVTPNPHPFQLTSPVGVYAPDRLQVAQALWCRSVRGSLNGSGFRQKLSLRAPAAVGRGGQSFPFDLSYVTGGTKDAVSAARFW